MKTHYESWPQPMLEPTVTLIPKLKNTFATFKQSWCGLCGLALNNELSSSFKRSMSCDRLTSNRSWLMPMCAFFPLSFLFVPSCPTSFFTSSTLSASGLTHVRRRLSHVSRRSSIWEVSSGAMKAVASSRLCQLALPRPAAAGWQPSRPLSPMVSENTARLPVK